MKGCPARLILGLNFARGKIHALFSLCASMPLPSALPSFFAEFLGSVFFRAWCAPWPQSPSRTRMVPSSRGISTGFAGGGALVEQVEARLRFVVWNPFADGLPRRLDGLEGVDVEGRGRRWRDVDDSFPKSVEAEEEFDFTGAEEGVHDFHGGLAAGALKRAPPQTRRMRSRQSGRMARAVTLGGGGTMGGLGVVGLSSSDSTLAMFRRGMPRLLLE